MPDIIVLAGCGTIKATVIEILSRYQSIGCRRITFDVYDLRDIRRLNLNRRLNQQDLFDSGCYLRCHEFLREFTKVYRYSMVLFDYNGCGCEDSTPEEIEQDVEGRMFANGWKNRSAAIVLYPEIESWVWSQSPQVERILGWKDRRPTLREWLVINKFIEISNEKPQEPKEAMQSALNMIGERFGSGFHRELAKNVSFKNCQDRSFNKFKNTLKTWFPIETES